ncbi:hypothetical protein [Methanobrevibacter sp.]
MQQNSYIRTEFCLCEDKSGTIWNNPYIYIDWPLDDIVRLFYQIRTSGQI